MGMSPIDYAVLTIYAIGLVSIAWYISREPAGHEKNTQDYFLAGKALPWWAIGTSLVAANISAEQVIGMSGSGFAIGLGIASYEWMAALTLLIAGKFFLPVFLKQRIHTMPQFLEQRYGPAVRSLMAVFWLGVYTLVNLTSILWLGALTIHTLTGLQLTGGLLCLAAFAIVYSLYGGLKAIALTDVIQVVLLLLGGLLICYLTLDAVSGGKGVVEGFGLLMERAPEKFDMILASDNPNWQYLPGLSVLVGGLWIMNLSYWGFNQYIIQRALAAKSVREAQAGIVLAAFLKLLMPVLVVLPGIAAFVLRPDLLRPDEAYPTMMTLAPPGIRGLIFAALVAAIVSSLGSMVNSIATIFTLDLYKPMRPDTPETRLVWIGRGAAMCAMVIAVAAAQPLLGQSEQAFQYIQEFTGFFTPGIVVLFLFGMFWKRMTAAAAFSAALGSAVFSLVLKVGFAEMPFMNRVGYVFIACALTAVTISLVQGEGQGHRAIDLLGKDFRTSRRFNLASAVIAAAIVGLYWYWW